MGHAHRRGKVLIVEDNASNRSFMTEICGAFGWNCDAVDGGIACVDAVSRETETYEVILMDIHMPDMSGIEAATKIREMQKDPSRKLPIIAVSSDQSSEMINACRDVGMDDFLAKPINIHELRERVERFLPKC